MIFRSVDSTLRKSTLNVDLGTPKWPKSVLLRKKRFFFLRPVSELIFSLKEFSLKVLPGNNHPLPGKILYVEKNDPKLTKNRFFGYGILTTFGKSHSSTRNIDNNYEKVSFAKNYFKNRL